MGTLELTDWVSKDHKNFETLKSSKLLTTCLHVENFLTILKIFEREIFFIAVLDMSSIFGSFIHLLIDL